MREKQKEAQRDRKSIRARQRESERARERDLKRGDLEQGARGEGRDISGMRFGREERDLAHALTRLHYRHLYAIVKQ